MKVAVLGPGGVGGFLAAMLGHAGNDVLVVASERTAGDLARDGLRLESGRYGSFAVSVRTATRLAEPVDAVLVTVKATQLAEAMKRAPAEALGEAIVVPFLNGIEHVEALRAHYPAGSVVAATIRIETTKERAGFIKHTSPFAAIELAPSPANAVRATALAGALSATGIDVRTRDDERQMLWDKLAVLEPMALLTTLERAPIGVIRARRREDLVALIHENALVAASEGAVIDPDRVLKFIDSVHESMESSMQRDDAAGRPLELDALAGAIIRRAEKHEVDIPMTRRIVGELHSRVNR